MSADTNAAPLTDAELARWKAEAKYGFHQVRGASSFEDTQRLLATIDALQSRLAQPVEVTDALVQAICELEFEWYAEGHEEYDHYPDECADCRRVTIRSILKCAALASRPA